MDIKWLCCDFKLLSSQFKQFLGILSKRSTHTQNSTVQYISCETNHTLKPGKKKKIRRKSLILQYRVVYMHISWFIHISHTIVRTLRPKPLQKGLSSKASEKITHRLKVCSRAVGPLKVTRLHHVPKAVSSTVLHSFPVKLGTSWQLYFCIEVFETYHIYLIHGTYDVF